MTNVLKVVKIENFQNITSDHNREMYEQVHIIIFYLIKTQLNNFVAL